MNAFTSNIFRICQGQVCHREKPLLGRGLAPDEIRHVTHTARRLAALIALQPALDDNYRQITTP